MRRLDAYILKEIVLATLSIPAILIIILWLLRSLTHFELLVDARLPLHVFARMVLLSLPEALLVILPISLFIATISAYNRLLVDSEIAVMRAAGMAPLRIARPALIAALVACVLGYGFTLWVFPASETARQNLSQTVQAQTAGVALRAGEFTSVGNLTFFVRERQGDGRLAGVMVHRRSDDGATTTILAESGQLVTRRNRQALILTNGTRQDIGRDGSGSDVLYFDRHSFDIGALTPESAERAITFRERGLTELLNPEDYIDDPSDQRRWLVEAHYRLLQPLYCLSFMLVAVAALIQGEQRRGGYGKRIAAATVFVVVAQAGAIAIMNAARESAQLATWAYVEVAVLILASLWLMHHMPKRRRKRRRPPAAPAGATDPAPAGAPP